MILPPTKQKWGQAILPWRVHCQ